LSDRKEFFAARLPEVLLDAISATNRRFDAIIVDEGQDFEALWWISIQELLKDSTQGPLYIFYDDNQHIYSTQIEFPIKEDPLLLCENCRNTQKIHSQVMKSYRGSFETTCLGPEGRMPQTILVSGDDHERSVVSELISRLVKQESVPLESIMLLTPKALGKSQWREGERLAGFQITWNGCGTDHTIGCSTIHSFKGLESPVVILTEMSESDQDRHAQLEYVGCSRAKSHLIIVRHTAAPN